MNRLNMNTSQTDEKGFIVSGLHTGKVLLVGESMGLFAAEEEGACSSVEDFDSSVAGAELNVAIGLKRLGQEPEYLTRVGDDPLGKKVVGFMHCNHLDTSNVITDGRRHTGFMLKTKVSNGDPLTYYFRTDSAASALSPDDIFNIDFSDIALVHVTGILPPLSDSALEATEALIARAEFNHAFITFDPNLRPALWRDEKTMSSTLRRLASHADMVLPGKSEGRALFGLSDPRDIGRAFVGNGAHYAVVKDGARGAWATDGEHDIYVPGFVVDEVVDTVGAGDGFAAGLLSVLLEGGTIRSAMERACAVGAMQTQFVSDNQGLPDLMDLNAFECSHERVQRSTVVL